MENHTKRERDKRGGERVMQQEERCPAVSTPGDATDGYLELCTDDTVVGII